MISPADAFALDQQEAEAVAQLGTLVSNYMHARRAGSTHTQALIGTAVGLHLVVAEQPLTVSSILAVAVSRLGIDQLHKEGREA